MYLGISLRSAIMANVPLDPYAYNINNLLDNSTFLLNRELLSLDYILINYFINCHKLINAFNSTYGNRIEDSSSLEQ